MMKRNAGALLVSILGLALMIAFQNCARQGTETSDPSAGTETGDPSLRIEFSAYNQTSLLEKLILPRAYAAVAGAQMCVHQIRMFKKQPSPGAGVVVVDVNGLITLSPSGTLIGEFEIESAVYQRVDIMVKDECGVGLSIQVQNDSGTFTGTLPKILRFNGEFEVKNENERLVLDIVPFINFFDTVTSDAELGAGVENIESQF